MIFASKARLRLRPGKYPISEKNALADLAIRIDTRFGGTNLLPIGERLVSIRRSESDKENNIEPLKIHFADDPC